MLEGHELISTQAIEAITNKKEELEKQLEDELKFRHEKGRVKLLQREYQTVDDWRAALTWAERILRVGDVKKFVEIDILPERSPDKGNSPPQEE
jgi:lipopolysaccharide biosynthesis regulator YciM